jgi:hypothetical protein
MNDNVEDLMELRLWSLEKIKENMARVACAYNKKVKLKGSKSEIWYGKRCYHWEPRMQFMENGLQIGMGLIELTKSCSKTHIFLRSWTVSSSQYLSTASISRSIAPPCGMIDSK